MDHLLAQNPNALKSAQTRLAVEGIGSLLFERQMIQWQWVRRTGPARLMIWSEDVVSIRNSGFRRELNESM